MATKPTCGMNTSLAQMIMLIILLSSIFGKEANNSESQIDLVFVIMLSSENHLPCFIDSNCPASQAINFGYLYEKSNYYINIYKSVPSENNNF